MSAVDVSAYNCLQLLYALLLCEQEKPYQMMAIGAWNFEYREQTSKLLGESISCKQRITTEEALYKFHGTIIKHHERSKDQCWEDVIRSILDSKQKIIVNTDSFWCPWSRAYGKKHFMHSFLLTNMERANVSCLDPYLQVEQQVVHLLSVEPGFRSISYIVSSQEECNNGDFVLEELYKDLVDTSRTSMFFDLDDFAYRIGNENMEKECTNHRDQLYTVPLFSEMKKIVMSRKSYSYMLKYVSEKYMGSTISSIAMELYSVAKRWDEIRSRLIRVTMRSSIREQNSIADDMHMIINQEKSLLFELLDEIFEERSRCGHE